MQHSWFLTNIFMESGMKQVDEASSLSERGNERFLHLQAASKPLQDEKVALEHLLLTDFRRKRPVTKHVQSGSVFVKIKTNNTTGNTSSEYFISQCSLGSVVFFWGKHLPVCHWRRANKSIVSVKSSTSPMDYSAQCRWVCSSAKCCHKGKSQACWPLSMSQGTDTKQEEISPWISAQVLKEALIVPAVFKWNYPNSWRKK